MTQFSIRRFNPLVVQTLKNKGVPEALARVLSARGIESSDDIDYDIRGLIPPDRLLNNKKAGGMLADAIEQQKKIVVIGDYDCDGATATATAVLGLRMLGAAGPDFLIPDRQKDGYGLSAPLVDRALELGAEMLVTVDNGISAHEAISYAKSRGLTTLVTDHHLPADTLPEADCIVNPNQPRDTFPSKNLAGVGVIFYVLLAARSVLRERGRYAAQRQPNLSVLLDLVGLGTVADVVRLDKNNRILVHKALERIRKGVMNPGIAALLEVTRKNGCTLTATDLGFSLAPRINASGRLENMATGIDCLLAPDIGRAAEMAARLNELNSQRREIEAEGLNEALSEIGTVQIGDENAICLFRESWHPGIVGLVASRIKDRCYLPTVCFAPSDDAAELKGSGRSIPGVHLRDVLDAVHKAAPDVVTKFGGHALAAGVTIRREGFERFRTLFMNCVKALAMPDAFNRVTATDGELRAEDFSIPFTLALRSEVWGAGFPEPIFMNRFRVLSQTLLKEQHLKLRLETDGMALSAIWFRHTKTLPETATLAYRLCINEWNGRRTVELMIEGMDESEDAF
jgi:single-stranded-DNA-specific exonuclease